MIGYPRYELQLLSLTPYEWSKRLKRAAVGDKILFGLIKDLTYVWQFDIYIELDS